MACSRRTKFIITTAIGCTSVVIGLLLYVFMPTIIEAIVKDKLILAKDSYTYDMWKDVPIPIYLSFYLFNVTNHEQVLAHKEEPNLEEVGPYTFLEKRSKQNITFNNNGTVTYQQKRVWHFVKEKSNASLSDMIVNLNVPLVSAAYGIRTKFEPVGRPFLYEAIKDGCEGGMDCSVFVKHSASVLMFDGYEDPLIPLAQQVYNLPYNKFGFFYGRNDSASDGVYNIFTGKSDINKLGLMDNWNYSNSLSQFWSGGQCNRLDMSSAGEFRPPYKLTKSNQPIYMFVGDICRSIKFVYEKDVDVNDIKCKRYVADQSIFDYSLDENKCYCGSVDGCPANGVANISSCSFGAPVLISFAHFLYADKSYSKFINGLKPSEDKHRFYMDIEPTFGIPISLNAKIQINVLLEKDTHLQFSSNLKHDKLLIPQLWTSISVQMDDDTADKLKLILNTVPLIDDILSFVLMGFGVLLLLLVFYFRYFNSSRKLPVQNRNSKNGVI